MKRIFNIKSAALILSVATLASCQNDMSKLKEYIVEKPAGMADNSALNGYSTLFQYMPEGVKLGTTISNQEYSDKTSNTVALVNSNFTEVQSPSDMMYGTAVNNAGAMNFVMAEAFTRSAAKAGKSVYGTSLCDYQNQNGAYLNDLIAPYVDGGGELVFVEKWVEQLSGGDLNDGINGLFQDYYWWSGLSQGHDATGGVDGTGCFWYENTENHENGWEGSIHFMVPAFEEPKSADGDIYRLAFDLKVTQPLTYYGGVISDSWQGLSWDITSFEPDQWYRVTVEFSIMPGSNSVGRNQLNFDVANTINKFYIDNVSLTRKEIVQEGTMIEYTPEEKDQMITTAMNEWVSGVIAATPEVKTWAAIANPLSDEDPSVLRGANGAVLEDKSLFYWADYMGEDYACDVVKAAREASSDLKLFVEESGLENAAKCAALVERIKSWESDGITKFDGITAVLNPVIGEDATAQLAYEASIVEMFKTLAATGKLIKLSGLDMSIMAGGISLDLPLFEEEHLKMADFYQFIINAYLTEVPAAQQYGIHKTSVVDTTAPVGLWDSSYNRKVTFKGFVLPFLNE